MLVCATTIYGHFAHTHFTFHTWAASAARVASVLQPNWNASEFVAVYSGPSVKSADSQRFDDIITQHTHRTSLSWHCHCHYALKGLVAKFNFLHLNGFAANIHNCCNILWHPELHAQLTGIACCLVIVSTKPLNVTKCFVSSPPSRQSIFTMGNQFPYLLTPSWSGNDYSIGIFSFHKLL